MSLNLSVCYMEWQHDMVLLALCSIHHMFQGRESMDESLLNPSPLKGFTGSVSHGKMLLSEIPPLEFIAYSPGKYVHILLD